MRDFAKLNVRSVRGKIFLHVFLCLLNVSYSVNIVLFVGILDLELFLAEK